ncbi:hypothetical protein DPMN_127867 [Dreissena polymorpha]|uniref:Uncharacterized protein n=1 Tax=Dreissena polymorpha TaxID=45954 RepID=A0A9D4JZK7_DREPO|nr:hypothetical protein DPMN_127867 [Dreissena polymorpha]
MVFNQRLGGPEFDPNNESILYIFSKATIAKQLLLVLPRKRTQECLENRSMYHRL